MAAEALSWLDGVCGMPVRHVPSPNHSAPTRTLESIGAIVIHTAETGEVSHAAEALGDWVSGPSRPRASWHVAVDCDSLVQSVALDRTAWHVGAANPWTIGIELAGRARQTPEQWRDEYSEAVLRNAAALCALLCDVYGLPVLRASHDEIREAHRHNHGDDPALKIGLAGHVDCNEALGVNGGHWDPGPHFPWGDFLDMIRSTP